MTGGPTRGGPNGGVPAVRAASTAAAQQFRREPRWTNRVEVATPVAGRRLTGVHWWDPDRIAHVNDAPAFCPACGTGLDGPGSLAVEYWQGDDRTFHTLCGGCGWSGDITRVTRMVGHESPHE